MLDQLTPQTLRLLMGLTFFALGLLSLGAGMLMLIFGPYRREAKMLAAQSARITQKALTDNIAAVAQSATALVEAVNNLIRTSSGNAIVLLILGVLCQLAAYRLLILEQ